LRNQQHADAYEQADANAAASTQPAVHEARALVSLSTMFDVGALSAILPAMSGQGPLLGFLLALTHLRSFTYVWFRPGVG